MWWQNREFGNATLLMTYGLWLLEDAGSDPQGIGRTVWIRWYHYPLQRFLDLWFFLRGRQHSTGSGTKGISDCKRISLDQLIICSQSLIISWETKHRVIEKLSQKPPQPWCSFGSDSWLSFTGCWLDHGSPLYSLLFLFVACSTTLSPTASSSSLHFPLGLISSIPSWAQLYYGLLNGLQNMNKLG